MLGLGVVPGVLRCVAALGLPIHWRRGPFILIDCCIASGESVWQRPRWLAGTVVARTRALQGAGGTFLSG
jgi:hypothetical protein